MLRLNITLGHNASAGLFDNLGNCVCAYEEERLTKVKSDSSFPKLAIERCLMFSSDVVEEIRVSHWFDTKPLDLSLPENKYCLPKYLERRLPEAKVVIDGRTHHDHHAQSVWNFSGSNKGLTVVADGFGNNEECISVYRDGKLLERVSNLNFSLGLMFQYATSAAGLKENEDEYKLLGYEIHSNCVPEEVPFPFSTAIRKPNELINYSKLGEIREHYHNYFKGMSREDIARRAQYTLESRMLALITKYRNCGDMLYLSGGVFYNVKLNNLLMRTFGLICVNPVAGDQGNIFGHENCLMGDLLLGTRFVHKITPKGDGEIFTSFRGDMEFGPRALGNTSTIALATMENVEKINNYNNRDTMMPMAPIVTREFFMRNFEDVRSCFKSERFMVVSFDFKTMKDEWRGAAHFDPMRKVYTGRVQVIDKAHHLYDFINSKGGIMINTSLNFHGTPILFDDSDLIRYEKLILN